MAQYLRQRRGRYLVQMAVPARLRSIFGKANLEKYLGTSDAMEARRKAPAAVAELQERIARQGAPLDQREIRGLTEAELHRAYDSLAADFVNQHGELPTLANRTALDIEYPIMTEVNENPLLGERTAEYASGLIRRQGAEPTEESVRELSMAILKAQAAAIAMLQRGITPPARPDRPSAPRKPGSTPTLQTIVPAWLRERKPPERTEQEWRRAARRFEELHGAVAVSDISRSMVATFKDELLKCPARPSHSLRELPLPDLVKRCPDGVEMVSAAAVNKTLGAVRSLLSYAVRQGYIDANPASGVAALAPRKREDELRRPFTPDELRTILDAAWQQKRAADRWIPWLAAATGARQSELALALVSDVRQEDGIWYLRITDAGEGRSVKTDGSRRSVPLHPVLIERGLLDYVESLDPDGRLFPNLKVPPYSKRFNRMVDDLGITDPAAVFHSFRHGFKDACRAAGVSEEVHDALTGHSGRSIGRDYGKGVPLSVLAEAIGKITYR
jgi:integrase